MLIGIHVDGVPFDTLQPLTAVEAHAGSINIVHWFQAWGGGHQMFRPDWLDRVRSSGRQGLITWEPWALTGEIAQPDFTSATIAAGDHDDYIRSWAEGFAALEGGRWALRPMHEMNGNWYPWAAGLPGNEPEVFIAAWVHLHDLFVAAGATEVDWVWCPLADDVVGPFEHYYPGADYVDVLALDGYNWGDEVPENGGWRSPTELFGDAHRRLAALGPQPIWFAEVGCAVPGPEAAPHPGRDPAVWVGELLGDERYERLEAVVFFSLDKERNWRIDGDPRIGAAIRAAR